MRSGSKRARGPCGVQREPDLEAVLLEERLQERDDPFDRGRERGLADLEHPVARDVPRRLDQVADEAREALTALRALVEEAALLFVQGPDLLAEQEPRVAGDHRDRRPQLVAHDHQQLLALGGLAAMPLAQGGQLAVRVVERTPGAEQLLLERPQARPGRAVRPLPVPDLGPTLRHARPGPLRAGSGLPAGGMFPRPDAGRIWPPSSSPGSGPTFNRARPSEIRGLTAEDRAAAERRMEHLAAELSRHARLYYVHDKPEISDAEYDRLVRELQALEARWPDLLRPDSPTQRIGAPPAEGFTPAPHRVPMLSLDNAMDEAEMRAFDERVRRILGSAEPVAYAGEPKLDGAGVELVYETGRLAVGATRGDGRVGEDVTSNLRLVWSVPARARCRRADAPAARLGARRGDPPARRLRAAEPRACRSGRRAVREPPQRGGGLAAAAPRDRHAPARRARVPRLRPGRGRAAGRADADGRARDPARLGLRREPGERALPRRRRRHRVPREDARAARVASDRERRRGVQGGPPRPPARGRRAAAVAPLGDRVQVSPAAGDDGRRGDRGQRGAHRSAHPRGEAAARARRRRDRLERVAPQRGRGRAQGRARRRHRR